jgi:hypothetical protein
MEGMELKEETQNIRLRVKDKCKCGQGVYCIINYEVVELTEGGQYYRFEAQCTNCAEVKVWLRKDRRICPISL